MLSRLKRDDAYLEARLDEALCSQTDPEAFFPIKGMNARDATDICNRCPIQKECLLSAIVNNFDGVWGGTVVRERRAFRQKPLKLELLRKEVQERHARYIQEERKREQSETFEDYYFD